MTQLEELKHILMNQEFVPISQIRMAFNYRSRISDLRKQGLDIKSVKMRNESGIVVHGYKFINPKVKQNVFDFSR